MSGSRVEQGSLQQCGASLKVLPKKLENFLLQSWPISTFTAGGKLRNSVMLPLLSSLLEGRPSILSLLEFQTLLGSCAPILPLLWPASSLS